MNREWDLNFLKKNGIINESTSQCEIDRRLRNMDQIRFIEEYYDGIKLSDAASMDKKDWLDLGYLHEHVWFVSSEGLILNGYVYMIFRYAGNRSYYIACKNGRNYLIRHTDIYRNYDHLDDEYEIAFDDGVRKIKGVKK